MQKRQMITQKGDNVFVSAVRGNFDDAQTGVKKIFANPDYARRAEEEGFFFSSANSINWGRLAPQIVYYISAYCDLVKENEIFEGDVVNVCVPTGNFGNIFAAYLARENGTPLGSLYARRIRTACSPISSKAANTTAHANSTRPCPLRWTFSFQAISNGFSM